MTTLAGKTFVITGANTGLGFETTKKLLERAATVVMIFRDKAKAVKSVEAAKTVAEKFKGAVDTVVMDLGDLGSIKAASEEILAKHQRIDCLMNNAGVMMCPKQFTKDGFEMQFGINHLGHFAFTMHLLPRLIENAKENPNDDFRIVNLSSSLHKGGPKQGILFDDLLWEKTSYDPTIAYGHSKFANILFTKELTTRFKAANINNIYVNSVHPGSVQTELTRHVDKIYGKYVVKMYLWFGGRLNVQKGALTQLFVATSPEIVSNEYKGEYFVPIAKLSKIHKKSPVPTKEMQNKLWEISNQLTKTKSSI